MCFYTTVCHNPHRSLFNVGGPSHLRNPLIFELRGLRSLLQLSSGFPIRYRVLAVMGVLGWQMMINFHLGHLQLSADLAQMLSFPLICFLIRMLC